ncbi:MAG: hypothetical protein Q4C80_05835 [Bacillota bacterium]|nr:hypothetical protein [Bacillota bacterium]
MSDNGNKTSGFIVRFLIIFIPLMIMMFLMHIAGITKNLFMTIILSLAIVWMIQSIYKKALKAKEEKEIK